MGWFLAGYFGGWYLLFAAGFIHWLTTNPEQLSVGTVLFGVFAYSVLIPGLLFGLMEPVLANFAAKSSAALSAAIQRRTIGRIHASLIGLLCSLGAMVNCIVAWWAASTSGALSIEALGENGLAVAMMALMMGTLGIIAACPWVGLQFVLAHSGQEPSGM